MVKGFFVYGTLKVGFGNDTLVKHLLERSQEARVAGMALYDLGQYPGMVETAAETDYVYGEYQEFADAELALKRLDVLEGFREDRAPEQNHYNRVMVVVELANGATAMAYAYLYNRPQVLKDRGKLCEDGVWIPAYMKQKTA